MSLSPPPAPPPPPPPVSVFYVCPSLSACFSLSLSPSLPPSLSPPPLCLTVCLSVCLSVSLSLSLSLSLSFSLSLSLTTCSVLANALLALLWPFYGQIWLWPPTLCFENSSSETSHKCMVSSFSPPARYN